MTTSLATEPGVWGYVKRTVIVALCFSPLFLASVVSVPVCPTAGFFGFPCPGCGLTRATMATFRGDFSAALSFHPLVWIIAPLLLYTIVTASYAYITGRIQTRKTRSRISGRVTSIAAGALFVLLVGVWIARFFGAFGGPVVIESF